MLFFIIVTTFGCEEILKGLDGDSGDVSIAYYAYVTAYSVTTSDPGIYRNPLRSGYYYETEPGYYYYHYETSYLNGVSGYYTIYEDEGEAFWKDGEDNCFVLWMYTEYALFDILDCDDDLDYLASSTTSDENHSSSQQNTTDIALNQMSAEEVKQIADRIESSSNTVTKTGGKGKYRFVHKYLVTKKTK